MTAGLENALWFAKDEKGVEYKAQIYMDDIIGIDWGVNSWLHKHATGRNNSNSNSNDNLIN